MRRTYLVTVTGHQAGQHTLTVADNADGSRYVSGRSWGCSRDYRVASDREALALLLGEYVATMTTCRRVTR